MIVRPGPPSSAWGFLNNVIPFLLIVWGQTHIASGLASILNATTPLFAVVAAHFLTTDEKMTGNRLIGVIVGFAGVALMIGPSVLSSLGSNVLAQLAVLGAAFSYSLAGIFGRRFRRMGLAPIIPGGRASDCLDHPAAAGCPFCRPPMDAQHAFDRDLDGTGRPCGPRQRSPMSCSSVSWQRRALPT